MAKLILVRHGESTLNKENVYFGHLNPSLTSKGKEQLEILKDFSNCKWVFNPKKSYF